MFGGTILPFSRALQSPSFPLEQKPVQGIQNSFICNALSYKSIRVEQRYPKLQTKNFYLQNHWNNSKDPNCLESYLHWRLSNLVFCFSNGKSFLLKPIYWASPWRREHGWEERLILEGFYNLTSNSLKHWRRRPLEVTWPSLLPKARQSAASDQISCSATCPTLPCDGKAPLSQGDTSQCLGNRYLFPGVHPKPPRLQCVAVGSCYLSSALLAGAAQTPQLLFVDPLNNFLPFDRPSPSSQHLCWYGAPKTDTTLQLCSQWWGEGWGRASSWEWPQPHDVIQLPGCESSPWLTGTWHWVQTSPACSRSLASRGEPTPLADSSSATLRLSLVVPGMTPGVRPGEEDLSPCTQPERFNLLFQIQIWWHSHSRTPELNTSTGHFQQQDILPGHGFVQAKSPRHVRKSEQRFWV